MDYTAQRPRVATCYSCGEKKMCSAYVANYPESETGYVDECEVCSECEKELEIS